MSHHLSGEGEKLAELRTEAHFVSAISRGMQPGANLADFEEDGIFDDDDEDDTNEISRSRRRRRSTSKSEESVSDAISSNITRILEGLLKDYDKTERPGFKTGKCIQGVPSPGKPGLG